MINPRSLKVRIIYISAAFIALMLFAFAHWSSKKSGPESDFENSTGELEPKLENPALTGTPLPALMIEFNAPAHGRHFKLELHPDSSQAESERFDRILQMAREAKLFAMPLKDPAEINFSVQIEKRNFAAAFDVADIDHNPQAQAMIKLLEIYASSPPPALPQQTAENSPASASTVKFFHGE